MNNKAAWYSKLLILLIKNLSFTKYEKQKKKKKVKRNTEEKESVTVKNI